MDKMATQAVEEVRMVLPGIQALFGFQLTAVFNATSAASSLFHFFRPPTTDRFELRISEHAARSPAGSALSRFSHEARNRFRATPACDLRILAVKNVELTNNCSICSRRRLGRFGALSTASMRWCQKGMRINLGLEIGPFFPFCSTSTTHNGLQIRITPGYVAAS